ncbi:MAG: rRNA pseudouridine synthase [Dehalococcoidia bacterium]|nr:MAG: rRNA pseudouridine synthase [Dehalococcoidia bacterium]
MAEAIKQGRVAVNGKVASDFRLTISPDDKVTFDGHPVNLKPGKKLVYLMLNKPPGILTTTRDERGRDTVMALLPPKYRNLGLYPAGRLDKDSTGLLILTNDGNLTYKLTHPKFEHEKEYLVRLDKRLVLVDADRLKRGILLEDGRTRPATIKPAAEPLSYRITVHEGKKRQLRRMFAALGYRVEALQRVRIGRLLLGTLKEGESRELTQAEVASLMG